MLPASKQPVSIKTIGTALHRIYAKTLNKTRGLRDPDWVTAGLERSYVRRSTGEIRVALRGAGLARRCSLQRTERGPVKGIPFAVIHAPMLRRPSAVSSGNAPSGNRPHVQQEVAAPARHLD